MKIDKNMFWVKVDRTAAWVLLVSIITYLVSGYGMTKGIIDRQNAKIWHENILPAITVLSFAIHTYYAIRLALIRNRWWNKITKIGLISIYSIFVLGFGYVEYGFKSESEVKFRRMETTEQINSQTKIFSLEELAKYDGKNGNQAYVAIDGIVYDFSRVFRYGVHAGHSAGKDLTKEFYQAHDKSELDGFSVVGKLE